MLFPNLFAKQGVVSINEGRPFKGGFRQISGRSLAAYI